MQITLDLEYLEKIKICVLNVVAFAVEVCSLVTPFTSPTIMRLVTKKSIKLEESLELNA